MLGALVGTGASAQVAPDAATVAGYAREPRLKLHDAAQRGDLPALRALLAGADATALLKARDARGRTALHVAAHAGQREAIEALVRAGIDRDALEDDRYDAVTIAAVADDEATLRTLLSLGASARQVTSRYDGTALIAAAHLGHDGVVRQLIAAGAPLDHVNNLHWTALIEAVVLGNGGPRHQAVVRALLDAGARRDLTDRDGRTPLVLARERGFAEMVGMLGR
ncbi:ankyrin repeat domain-containing protein [Leptothrix sp. BB-4]